jgi:F-type H+-transporting ATPase subunit delta
MAETFEVESRSGDEGTSARKVARVYAEALLDVAESKNQADEIGRELAMLVNGVLKQNPDVAATLESPVVKRTVKAPLIAKAFKENSSELTFSLLNVLNSKDRLGLLRHIAAAYLQMLDVRAKRLRVVVKSVVPLSDDQLGHLKLAVGQAYGLEPIIVAKTEPDLLGGMIVQIGDLVFDGSVATKIKNIRNQLLARSSYEIQVGRDRFSTAG